MKNRQATRMVYIDKIQFRYFKSFRNTDIDFSKGFVALAGPNGSGKSNICDGIRFALGENSLKSLRAKKVADLIMMGSDKAEIRLHMRENGKKLEVRRSIRNDGKTKYRYNGKRMTRTAVMDALKQIGAEIGDHNVIAQGEVEEIVKMTAKERRAIIDTVSGISEFEDKRTEALKELSKVDSKINDATIVMNERDGFLQELEVEKDDAIKYKRLNADLHRMRGSLIYVELNRINEQHTHSLNRYLKLERRIEDIKREITYKQSQVSKLEREKHDIVDEINRRSKKDSAYREIEELRASIKMDSVSLDERKSGLKEIEKSISSMKDDREILDSRISSLNAEIKKLEEKLADTVVRLGELDTMRQSWLKDAGEVEARFTETREQLENVSDELESARMGEERVRGELAKEREVKKLKGTELLRLRSSSFSDDKKSTRLKGDISGVRANIKRLSEDAEKAFNKERSLNREIPDIEKKWLKARERVSELRARISPTASSAGLKAVLEMRDNGDIDGIHGTVSELCTFKPEHAVAIEASAGQRMNYIVVENVDVAARAIARLKRLKVGRCTFIPLDRKSGGGISVDAKVSGSMGPLIDVVSFKSRYRNAFTYVFGGTLLVKDVNSAKKATGKVRMVTLEGDLFELSGIITGGTFRSKLFLKEKKELEEVEKTAADMKRAREAFLNELHGIRTEMADIRKDKADKEVRLKSLEMELDDILKKTNEGNAAREEASALEKEIGTLGENIMGLESEARELRTKTQMLEKNKDGLKKLAEEIEKRSREKDISEMDNSIAESKSLKSSLQATLEGKRRELTLIEEQSDSLSEETRVSEKRKVRVKEDIGKLAKRVSENTTKLEENENKMKDIGDTIKKLFEKRNAIEKISGEISLQVGRIQHSYERAMKEMNEISVNKATFETKLVDLKAEFEKYRDVRPIESTKDEIESMVRGAEQTLSELGDVNLRAPELYEERKRDLEEIKIKVEKLAEEKSAIMVVIEEIDGKKRTIFIETFTAVGDNFKNLFKQVFEGEGFLALDNPSQPFDGGLSIRIRDKKNEKCLEAMSGGEKSLVTLLFIFSLHMYKPAPFYLLDEVEAALDEENSKKLALLLKRLSDNTQFIMITHNDQIISTADVALGVTRTESGSKVIGIQLK
ncbi:MAG: chromosome segregation protein SMC [Candidatus Micrarchaeota archaeon]